MRHAAWAVVLALVAAVSACKRTPGPVPLTAAWPERGGDYEDVTQEWTRRGVLRGEYQQVLELHATFRSPAWIRTAADHEARIRAVEGAARDELYARARATADGDYQFALVVTTYDPRENDLHRGERSVWRLALVDDAGRETAPTKIERDRRPLEVQRAELPEVTEFAQVYVATFPRTANVLRDDARKVALKMWSIRGSVVLEWRAP